MALPACALRHRLQLAHLSWLVIQAPAHLPANESGMGCLQKGQVSPVSQPMAQLMMQRTVKTKRHRNKLQGESALLSVQSCLDMETAAAASRGVVQLHFQLQGCLWRPDTSLRLPGRQSHKLCTCWPGRKRCTRA